jgi:hypothetical protein
MITNKKEVDNLMQMLLSNNKESQTLGITLLLQRKYTISGIFYTLRNYIRTQTEQNLCKMKLSPNKPVIFLSESLVELEDPRFKFLSFELCGKRTVRYPNRDHVQIISVAGSAYQNQSLGILYESDVKFEDKSPISFESKASEIVDSFIQHTFTQNEREILKFLNDFLV